MYHEIEAAGRALCDEAPGYVRYVVTEATFRDQLAQVRAGGYTGISVGQWMAGGSDRPAVVITFDDGSETDALIAATAIAHGLPVVTQDDDYEQIARAHPALRVMSV